MCCTSALGCYLEEGAPLSSRTDLRLQLKDNSYPFYHDCGASLVLCSTFNAKKNIYNEKK